MGKHLIALIDGTKVSAAHTATNRSYSNVFELACLLQILDRSKSGGPQVVFYRSGISSQPDSRNTYDLLTGNTIMSQIVDQYTNICANYNFDAKISKDKIYLFGFSRGAMAVRALASIISEFGLLDPRQIHFLPEVIYAWEHNEGRASLSNKVNLTTVEVEFIGIFDAVMGGISKLPVFNPVRFSNHDLPSLCRHGIHIIAIDEDRPHFTHKLWTGAKSRVLRGGKEAPNPSLRTQSFRQIWMPGIHSDIGGTGNAFLGNVALLSMVYFIERLTGLALDKEWIEDKEWRVRKGIADKKFRISANYMELPYRRKLESNGDFKQYYHPVCEIIQICKYKIFRIKYDWRNRVFEKGFKDRVIMDDLLYKYFRRIS
ncbi:hypothetical protein ASD67_18980 [Sphingopyxis sp. Root1497]|uniref:phospholipase effector Tle1 domain-containing protein n=1 Tax=Sphingopyxis sp. Root1497 TaxID=1736474 RepID=UPI000700C92E|nr:DUF2235 domain-containing protein [Sphingopyxis sp. Root1497]KQZ61324.1 hypothetical protein ASD67_18980 [Sphingopyxis sp. Root1497]